MPEFSGDANAGDLRGGGSCDDRLRRRLSFRENLMLNNHLTSERALRTNRDDTQAQVLPNNPDAQEAHAAARWARAIVPIIDCPQDPRTIAQWSRWIAASPAAIRNWCRKAGLTPRRSLVFGRMLRAVTRSEGGRHKPENIFDVVDVRTLSGLLRFAGISGQQLPKDIHEFLEQQTLIQDPDVLLELNRALEPHRR
jgi:hypothetical protein